ncbi:MAG TPA: S46 family peptidase, partial [Bacteroidales bacterium]|nr:S46 family peptidase [Bacteroidales bacterium]
LTTIQKYSNDYFTKNNMNIEKQSFPKIMIALDTLLAPHYLPTQYASLSNEQRKQYIQTIVQNSVLFSQEKNSELLNKLFKEQNKKTVTKINLLLNSDPGIVFVKQTLQHISNTLYRDYLVTLHNLDSIQQQYFTCLFEYKGQKLAPDANRTMRVSFGNVLPYKTADAVTYYSQTTSYGIQQKWNSSVKDYRYNARLDSLLQQKQYGSYSNDTLYINFAATNHTSGGNSGSPVLNAYGNFIGLNFDRNKEGTMSDFYFDEQFCRNISVDVRYILFCIEKYGNAYNILQELEFVNH